MPHEAKQDCAKNVFFELEQRWAQVDSWYDAAVSAAYSYRTFALDRLMLIQDHTKRCDAFEKISVRFEERLKDIDDAFYAFKDAYDVVRDEIYRKKIGAQEC